MIKRIALAAALAGLGVTAVVAQSDPLAARKALMKENGAQSRVAREMIEGKQPFDLAAAQKVLATFAAVDDKGKSLWPATSKDGDTASLPAVWENKADFDARFAKFAQDVAAAQAGIVDEASFKKLAPAVFKNCGGCHELYKAKSG